MHLTQDAPKPVRYGVVAIVVRDGRLLVIRRSSIVIAPLTYCFPGGGIEPGESEQAALIRELDEELGIQVRPIRRIWANVTPWHVDLAWWLAELVDSSPFKPNPAEVASVHWFSAAEMLVLPDLLQSNRPFLESVVNGIIDLSPNGP